jgi:hypothetical protein
VKLFNSKLELLFLILSLAPSIAASIFIIYSTPHFYELFEPLDKEVLVFPTRLFLNYFYFFVLVVPVTNFLIWKNWPFQKYRSVSCVLIGYFSGGLLLQFWVWAMYLPIYIMGTR